MSHPLQIWLLSPASKPTSSGRALHPHNHNFPPRSLHPATMPFPPSPPENKALLVGIIEGRCWFITLRFPWIKVPTTPLSHPRDPSPVHQHHLHEMPGVLGDNYKVNNKNENCKQQTTNMIRTTNNKGEHNWCLQTNGNMDHLPPDPRSFRTTIVKIPSRRPLSSQVVAENGRKSFNTRSTG